MFQVDPLPVTTAGRDVLFGENFSLTLLTNDPVIAKRGDRAGIDHIGLDFETLGKRARQPEASAWISHHTLEDLIAIGRVLERSRLFARIDPWHAGSARQVEELLAKGATSLMLPMFTSAVEVARFAELVSGRAYICLLLETPQAVVRIDDILEISGIDEISIGLNDLHRALGLRSHFEVLISDLMRMLSDKVRARGLRFGFGTIGRAMDNDLPVPSDLLYAQYPRLGATSARLFRPFLGSNPLSLDITREVKRLRGRLSFWGEQGAEAWEEARRELQQILCRQSAA
jgi:HpcH/HpaI aldolase/citrate lyase family